MNDCQFCEVEKDCHYPFKPTQCFNYRKYWDKETRANYEAEKRDEDNF